MARTERIEMRVDPDFKILAERAAAASGCNSVTEFLVRLVMENAPEILEKQQTIQLTNAQFDHFLAVCEDVNRKPSKRLQDAAKRLDKEGYWP